MVSYLIKNDTLMEQDAKKVGVAWERVFQESNTKKFNVSLPKKEVDNLPANENGKASLLIVKREKPDEKTGITHDVFLNNTNTPGQPKKIESELIIEVSKEDVSRINARNENVHLEAVMKKDIGKDRANFLVRELTEEKEKVYVGRGWTPSQSVKHDYVGNAWKNEFDNSGKMYNVSIEAEKLKQMPENQYGNVVLSVAQKKDAENQFSVYKSIGKEPYSDFSISLKKEDVLKLEPNEKGYYQLIVADKAKISKDKADLVVFENTYEKDKKAAVEKGVDIKEIQQGQPKNYVGAGWSNKIDHIRITDEDKTAKGLSAAIANNHPLKVAAILKQENVSNNSHVKLMKEMKQGSQPLDADMERMVNKYVADNKPQSKIKI